MDLLLITDVDKLHYVYIKDFNRFMFQKTKTKNQKHFCRIFHDRTKLKIVWIKN